MLERHAGLGVIDDMTIFKVQIDITWSRNYDYFYILIVLRAV